jgi:hypothetical protein
MPKLGKPSFVLNKTQNHNKEDQALYHTEGGWHALISRGSMGLSKILAVSWFRS